MCVLQTSRSSSWIKFKLNYFTKCIVISITFDNVELHFLLQISKIINIKSCPLRNICCFASYVKANQYFIYWILGINTILNKKQPLQRHLKNYKTLNACVHIFWIYTLFHTRAAHKKHTGHMPMGAEHEPSLDGLFWNGIKRTTLWQKIRFVPT